MKSRSVSINDPPRRDIENEAGGELVEATGEAEVATGEGSPCKAREFVKRLCGSFFAKFKGRIRR